MPPLLEQVLERSNLRLAWEKVAENCGIPGVDRVSIARWRRNWEERLENLRTSVLSGSYHPSPLRIRAIPKSTPGQWRILRIPTVNDRVLQRAALQVLFPLFEPRFLDCSFGYRPGFGLRQAVQRILDLREQDYTWVLDADIDAFFDSVNHALLLRFLEDSIEDFRLLQLISEWLAVRNAVNKPGTGIPMGSPLSPLLANIYLHPLDTALIQQGYHLVRYADDFIVLCQNRDTAEQAYFQVEAVLTDLFLKYEPDKTRISSFEEGFTFLGVRFLNKTFSFTYQEKTIESDDRQVSWLYSDYFPDYE